MRSIVSDVVHKSTPAISIICFNLRPLRFECAAEPRTAFYHYDEMREKVTSFRYDGRRYAAVKLQQRVNYHRRHASFAAFIAAHLVYIFRLLY